MVQATTQIQDGLRENYMVRLKEDFLIRKKIMSERSENKLYLLEIIRQLTFAIENHSPNTVRKIVEDLFLQEITEKQSQIFYEQISIAGNVEKFINIFKNHYNLGFTPYID